MTQSEFQNSKYWLMAKTFGSLNAGVKLHICDISGKNICGFSGMYYEFLGESVIKIEDERLIYAENKGICTNDPIIQSHYPLSVVCKKCLKAIRNNP